MQNAIASLTTSPLTNFIRPLKLIRVFLALINGS